MNVLCSAKACPVILSTSCVFYEGENLVYSGINTNDSVQVALQKLDAAIGSDVFTIGVVSPLQSTGGITPILSILKSSSSIDGYLSSVDWNIFNNKQNTVTLTTTGSTGASTFNSLTGALNIPDYSGAFSGFVPIGRTLTINGTSYDLSANRTWNVGTVTSVGITMPSAFNVSNSPITGSGTIAITAAGLASQYVRGDGILGDFPSNGGGGSSVSYYLNGSVNQGTFGGSTYYEMNRTPVIGGPGVNFSITNTSGLVSQFITDPLDPGLLLIPAGNWNIEFYFNASDATGAPYFYVELYVYNGTTFTLISSGATNPEYITNGLSVDIYYTSIAVPETVLTVNDRLAIRVYGNTDGARTITLHTEDDNLSQIITTFSNGLTALNGLTRQVQYFATGTTGVDFNISSSVDVHTFNLPTASASNRGALSSGDWTIFNNKQNALTLTTTGTSGASTLVGATLNIPQYQAALTNPVTGTGVAGQVAYWNGTSSQTGSATLTYTPTTSLLVNNSVTAASLIARGTNLTPTLVASANNDVLVGLDIAPTFTNGAFSGVSNYAARLQNKAIISVSSAALLNSGNTYALEINQAGINFNIGATANVVALQSFVGKPISINSQGNNVIIGSTTDGGQRLQVQGTTLLNGNVNISGSTTAASGIARNLVNPTLVAAANNDILVALDIQPAFTNGAFTGVGNFGLRTNGKIYVSDGTQGFALQNASISTNGGIYVNNYSNFNSTVNLGGTHFNNGGFSTGFGIAQSSSNTTITSVRGAVIGVPSLTATSVSGTEVVAVQLQGLFTKGSGTTVTYAKVLDLTSLSGGVNNTILTISNTTVNNQQTGNWSIYNASTYSNYFEGDTAIGTTTLGTATKLTIGGSETASSAIARGTLINTTLTAAANNDVLVGLDIDPTFTNGAFTGVTNYSARISNQKALLIASDGGTIDFINNGTNGRIRSAGGTFSITVGSGTDGSFPLQIGHTSPTGTKGLSLAANIIRFQTGGFGSTVGQIFSTTGNWVLQNGGTFTDNGARLQVAGTSYFSDSVGVGSIASAGETITVSKNITGGIFSSGVSQKGIVQSDVTSSAFGFINTVSSQNAVFAFSYVHYAAAQGTIGASSSLTTHTGFLASNSLTTGGNIFGFRGQVTSGAGKWNMYMEGTANNYMAGNLLLGTTTNTGQRLQVTSSTGDSHLLVWGATAPSIRLDNAGSAATQRFAIGLATATNNFIQGAAAGDVCITTASASPMLFGMWQTSSASEAMRITTSRNLLINKTTDGGQKLQVSGTVNFASLPTSATGLSAGDIWNDSGTLKIV